MGEVGGDFAGGLSAGERPGRGDLAGERGACACFLVLDGRRQRKERGDTHFATGSGVTPYQESSVSQTPSSQREKMS